MNKVAARFIIEQFVKHHDGNPTDIIEHPDRFTWKHPDGRIARVDWV